MKEIIENSKMDTFTMHIRAGATFQFKLTRICELVGASAFYPSVAPGLACP